MLRVQREAVKMLMPGVIYYEYHKEVQKIMEHELIKLKLLDRKEIKNQPKEKPLLMKYFIHGIGHQLGLDVHDVGNMYHKMQVGQVWNGK